MLLEIKNINKHYQKYQALNNVTLSIPKGSIYGLLGPNGAGKTSLIRIINQITGPDNGEVILDGEKLSPKHIANIGYLPEERGLYKDMKIGDQAIYLAQLKGMSKSDAKKRLEFWFNKFKIEGWWDKKVSELSKGMAQKVQFIITVLHEPKLLIFDEPFSGFDPVNANLIKDEILELKENGATIIFSTHRMESVEEMCDHIALIHQSKVVIEGGLQDIKQQFKKNVFTLGFTNIVDSNVSKNSHVIRSQKIDNKTILTLNLGDTSPNQILSEMMNFGTVEKFEEIIPSVNDIFIELVK